MLGPGALTPELPPLVREHSRVGNNLLSIIDEENAADGIAWAQRLIGDGIAEEYALGAITLEDAYIRLTGHSSAEPVEVAS
jgi:ABC-2 type transport system ATP-binding protein